MPTDSKTVTRAISAEERHLLSVLLESMMLVHPGQLALRIAEGLAERGLVKLRDHGVSMKWISITEEGRALVAKDTE